MPTQVGNFQVPLDRRTVVLGATALAAVVLGGGGYWAWKNGNAPAETAAKTDTSAATVSIPELMTPGPLGDRILGNDNAPVTIVEYASMTCPHCAHFEHETFPKLKERYIDTGKVRYIFRDFPLDIVAAAAAIVARCAEPDKYYPLVELLFETQNQWAVQNAKGPLFNIVRQAGFTEDAYNQCLANRQMIDALQSERDRATAKFGVNSTPTFFVNGKRIPGAVSIEDLEKEIQPYLKVS